MSASRPAASPRSAPRRQRDAVCPARRARLGVGLGGVVVVVVVSAGALRGQQQAEEQRDAREDDERRDEVALLAARGPLLLQWGQGLCGDGLLRRDDDARFDVDVDVRFRHDFAR